MRYMIIGLVLCITGCGFLRAHKDEILTILDLALATCINDADAHADQLAGKTPQEWCREADRFKEYVEPLMAAQATAGGSVGLRRE